MEKLYIVITGRSNTGKSSLVNAILGQSKSVVSSQAGTTTDPVKKSYEIPGVASVVLVDTAGIDDEGEIGRLRIEKTWEAVEQADMAVLVISGNRFGEEEERLISEFRRLKQPFLIVHNKSDLAPLAPALLETLTRRYDVPVIDFSTQQSAPDELLKALIPLLPTTQPATLLGALLHPGQTVLLITPIDSEAPAGRLILPQVQMLRDILDNRYIGIILQPEELPAYLATHTPAPDLVITDSQAFGRVAALLPPEIPLTSFSIILAHHKGNFNHYLKGTTQIASLRDNDRILMLESCSHHVSCEDIGRVKLPALLRKYSGKKLTFDFVAGLSRIQRPLTDYALILQCGGCMVTATQLRNRLQTAIDAGIPVSNYGMAIAFTQGIFERAVKPFIDCPNPGV